MGLVQAVVGSAGGVLADQWKDFYTVQAGLPATAALFAAVPQGTNAGRGSNTKGSAVSSLKRDASDEVRGQC